MRCSVVFYEVLLHIRFSFRNVSIFSKHCVPFKGKYSVFISAVAMCGVFILFISFGVACVSICVACGAAAVCVRAVRVWVFLCRRGTADRGRPPAPVEF